MTLPLPSGLLLALLLGLAEAAPQFLHYSPGCISFMHLKLESREAKVPSPGVVQRIAQLASING